MSEEGRQLLMDGIDRNDLTLIQSNTFRENIDHRIKIYYSGSSPKAYINVGGGVVSAGRHVYKRMLKPGLVRSEPHPPGKIDSVVHRFINERIPVIHLDNVEMLAKEHGFPLHPTAMPSIGEGKVYSRKEYNRWLAGSVLAAIILTLYIFSRSDRGFRIMEAISRKEDQGPPELMI